MSYTHSRVAPGSLLLLTHPVNEPLPTGVSPETIARSYAQAQARLRSGLTTTFYASTPGAPDLVEYATSLSRPLVVTGPSAESVTRHIAHPVRVVGDQGIVLLGQDLSAVTDPIVVFGDLHQCWRTYEQLREEAHRRYGDNVLLVAAGDLFDKGGNGPSDVVTTAQVLMRDYANGDLVAVAGNHDWVLSQRLHKALGPGESLAAVHRTPRALLEHSTSFAANVMHWLQSLPIHIRVNADTVVVHAAWDPELASSKADSKRFTETCLYGPRPAKGQPRFDARGKYVWVDWAPSYQGTDTVIHGHHSDTHVRVTGKVIALDTGCVDGNKLSAFLVGADPHHDGSFLVLDPHPEDLSTKRSAKNTTELVH